MDNQIDREESKKAAKGQFLSTIPEEIKQAYNSEVITSLAKQFEIADQELLQWHLYLAAKFYLKAQEPGTKRRPSDIKREMTSISDKATALLIQLSRMDPIIRDYLEQADSLIIGARIEELMQVTEHQICVEQISPSEDKMMSRPRLRDIEAGLKYLNTLSELILDSLKGDKGGKPPNKAMPMWVRSAERLLEETSGKTPGPKRLFDFCYESLAYLEDEPNDSAIEETIKALRKARKHRSAKV